MKRNRFSARSIVAWVIGIYAAIIFLLNMPFMQSFMASQTANVLSSILDTKVEVGSVNVGFLNRLIIDDIYIQDQNRKQMLKVARVSAKINLLSLLKGQVNISTAQLFGANATLYKSTPDSTPNYQFLIDAFSSDSEEKTPVDIRINSLIVRRANINYDILSLPTRLHSIDTNHIHLRDAGFNLSLKCLTDDSLNLSLKRMSATEEVSGLALTELRTSIEANKRSASIEDFCIRLLDSQITIDSTRVNYSFNSPDKPFALSDTHISVHITPSNLSCFIPELSKAHSPFDLDIIASATDNSLNIKSMSLSSASNDLSLNIDAQANNIHLLAANDSTHSVPSFKDGEYSVNIQKLILTSDASARLASEYPMLSAAMDRLASINKISYSGNITRSPSQTHSNGELTVNEGSIIYSADLDSKNNLDAHIDINEINLSPILQNEQFGTITLTADANANIDCIINPKSKTIPDGTFSANVDQMEYSGNIIRNINIDAANQANKLTTNIDVADDNVDLTANATFNDILSDIKGIVTDIDIRRMNPKSIGLASQIPADDLSLRLNASLKGSDLNNLTGVLTLQDIKATEDNKSYSLDQLYADLSQNANGKSLHLSSDFIEADVNGHFQLNELPANFQNIIARHLPLVVRPVQVDSDANFRYNLTFYDAPLLHRFIDADYAVNEPIHAEGSVSSTDNRSTLSLKASGVEYDSNIISDLNLQCNGSRNNLMVNLSGKSSNPSNNSAMDLSLIAIVRNNKIDSDIQLNNHSGNDLSLKLFTTTNLSDNNGHLQTNIDISRSDLAINDTLWTISPAQLSIYNKEVACHNLKIQNGNQYIKVNGKASPLSTDSLVAELNDMQIEYILDLVNFHSVDFGGKASGHAILRNLYSSQPDFNANLQVKDFLFMHGHMGNANIQAFWNKEKHGIGFNARFYDLYKVKDGFNDKYLDMTGITRVNGYVSPADNYIDLGIDADNTSTDFLNGILDDVFSEIDGRVTGRLNVVGSLDDINIIGDVKANMNARLRATNVPYQIKEQPVHLAYGEFRFEDVKILDAYNHSAMVNGKVTHHNLSNFAYSFTADLNQLLAYNEKEFNSDKYLATVFADGTLNVRGSDGHPLYIDANVTPAKNSVFAYDAATPDAIASNSFIEFNDVTPKQTTQHLSFDRLNDTKTPAADNDADNNVYHGDVYINFIINLNPNCEVKLRMDNTEDGYISTFGNATFQARWHNKGSFQLFGNYNILNGKYRLYLQDIVYRNLDIQEGSTVEFNGNPFDANIHLICHHEIQSVPLSDLTGTRASMNNNKVKVICKLDITGHLDNMNLAFNFELPNVSEEVRQLVKSMVNSDEEMNNQMIYLLGLQRFYPNEYARANGDNNNVQAVNSLISSTLSGQINQVLSNMLGSNSKWTLGTGITTGDNGWDDLDVEGILSGRMFNDRLLINGNFGYRDNSMTNQANFIGDFELKYRIFENGDFYVKAYNQTNDRYFTKATLNTQGVGLSYQHSFEHFRLFRPKRNKERTDSIQTDSIPTKLKTSVTTH